MGDMDVPLPHAHLKRSKQAHHFHQLGMGVFLEEHGSEIDFAGGAERLIFIDIFKQINYTEYENCNSGCCVFVFDSALFVLICSSRSR
jgi:hypothetical protein